MMFNRSLKQIFEPIPQEFRMHDWWIILIAAFEGRIVYLDESLIQYRQHGNNTVGVVGMEKPTLIHKIRMASLYKTILLKVDMIRRSFLPYIQQERCREWSFRWIKKLLLIYCKVIFHFRIDSKSLARL